MYHFSCLSFFTLIEIFQHSIIFSHILLAWICILKQWSKLKNYCLQFIKSDFFFPLPIYNVLLSDLILVGNFWSDADCIWFL